MWQQFIAVLSQGVFPFAERPVIEQCALVHGVDLQQLLSRAGGVELPGLNGGGDSFGQPCEIVALILEQRTLILCYKLGRVEGSHQIYINTCLYHIEKLVIEEEQLVIRRQIGIYDSCKFFILFIEQVRECVEQSLFPLKIVVKGSF